MPGVTEDAFDEDGELELKFKVEPDQTIERCLITDKPVTEDCLTVDHKPEAILVNYNFWGFARVRFDGDSEKFWLENLRYVTSTSMRTYIWRTFKDMVQSNHLSVSNWYKLLSNNLEFETEEQTLYIVLD